MEDWMIQVENWIIQVEDWIIYTFKNNWSSRRCQVVYSCITNLAIVWS